jgi:hypothetical protein
MYRGKEKEDIRAHQRHLEKKNTAKTKKRHNINRQKRILFVPGDLSFK